MMTKKAKKSTRRPAGKKRRPAAGSANSRNLVVVESPAKARTINRYLGRGFLVKASMGHVRDLPAKEMGVDLEHDFEPTYEPLSGRKKVLADLKKHAKSAPQVFLATDLDREGEAIAWHLAESLRVPPGRIQRVIFNEITASAIQEAFAHPQSINMDKVNAQQARRILDRIVGYKISPLLWKKVAPGLSAGRVQSVAVRLIVDREREIEAFAPQEYWKVSAVFAAECRSAGELARQWEHFLAGRDEKGNPPTLAAQEEFLSRRQAFTAELVKWRGKKFQADRSADALQAARAVGLDVQQVKETEDSEGKGPAKNRVQVIGKLAADAPPFVVEGLNQRQRQTRPPAPFTTAGLQQAAAVQLGFSASRTMRTAQQLYEGVPVPGEGSVGLITYMRTDGTHLSRDAVAHVRSFIAASFGDAYLPDRPRAYASGERAQEAHEAIRPTDVDRSPDALTGALKTDQDKLYRLIWKRFVACQMVPAVWNITEADILADTPDGAALFKALGRCLDFDGFFRVAGIPRSGEQILPPLETNQTVAPIDLKATQHFTQPPPRYTEASLVKALEADNIGRPSTYASIIRTIQDRNYVEKVGRAFHPTHLGTAVTDKLVKHFPKVFAVRFTAHMEDQLDKIEQSHLDWLSVLREFYGPFSENLRRASEEMVHAKAETEPSQYTCETCGRKMVYRFSKTGRYLACTGYPKCKTTHPVDKDGKKVEKQVMDVACPACGESTILRKGRFGPFLSCSRYPDCEGIVNLDKTGGIKPPSAPPLEVELTCPKCDSPLLLRRGKRGPWLACSKFPKCRGRQALSALDDKQRKDLDRRLEEHEKQHPQPVIKSLDGTPLPSGHQPQPISQDQPASSEPSGRED